MPFDPRPFVVTENRPVADGVFSLFLRPEDGQAVFLYEAGQWVMLQILSGDGTVWRQAAFTIASYPSRDGILELGIKVFGDFTKRAQALAPGATVRLRGPYGAFVMPSDETPTVCLAGGIGITPFLAMARERVLAGDHRSFAVFLSNRFAREVGYVEEMRGLAKEGDFFFASTLTGEGERRRLSLPMIVEGAPWYQEAVFLLCGSEVFLDGMREMLLAGGVSLERIRREKFD